MARLLKTLPNTLILKSIKKSINKWHTPSNVSRHADVITTRARFGHTNLTHVHLITKEDQPVCSNCKTPLSIQHIVLDCPKFTSSRHILNHPSTMEEALGEHNTNLISTFFKSINIINNL